MLLFFRGGGGGVKQGNEFPGFNSKILWMLERLCPEHWLWLLTLDLVSFCTVLKHGWAFNSEYIYYEHSCC
jgi:hypothetical protein